MKQQPETTHAGASNRRLTEAVTLIFGIIALSAYIYKASNASFTHDESSTYLNFVIEDDINIVECHTDPRCWSTANNHLLNTQLMRYTRALFGSTELALRLPNLLLLFVFVGCALIWIRRESKSGAELMFGTALLLCNPFVLDFFALARGYGMGVGLMMLSLFGIWQYLQTSRSKWFALSFAAAVLSVFANLMFVTFVAALTLASVICVLVPIFRSRRTVRLDVTIPLTIVASLSLLAWYFYKPVMILMSHGEFDYGTSSLWNAWHTFIRDSLYGVQWFSQATTDVGTWIATLILCLALIAPWYGVRNKRRSEDVKQAQFLCIVTLGMIGLVVVNHLVTGAQYPFGRKAIMIFPPTALLIWYAARIFIKTSTAWMIFGGLAILFVVHLGRAFHADTFREWWYDQDTKQMIHDLAQESLPGEEPQLGVEWIYHPTTDFYVRTHHLPVRLSPYSKTIQPDGIESHYFVSQEHSTTLDSVFAVVKSYRGRLLFKRKATDARQIPEE